MKQDKQAEITFFDDFGNRSGYDVISEAGYQRILAEFMRHFDNTTHRKVIELGCGTGSFTERLSRLFPNVVGVDISENCITYARNNYSHIMFEPGDLEALPYADASYDMVFMFAVLHHFPNIKDALREPFRILKEDGMLFTYDPNINNPFFWVYHSERSPLYSAKTITKNEKFFSKDQLGAAMQDAGFEIRSLRCIAGVDLEPRHRKYSKYVKPFIYMFNAAEWILKFSQLRETIGSSIICAARKKGKINA